MPQSFATPGRRPRAALLASVGAAAALIGGWLLAQSLVPNDFNPIRESISALAARGMPHRWAMTSALVVAGALHIATAWSLTGMRKNGRIALAGAGLMTILLAAVPLPARGANSITHTLIAILAFVLLACWPWLGARPQSQGLLSSRVATWATIVMLGLVASMALTLGSPVFGLHERVVTTALVSWPLLTAITAWVRAGWPIGSPRSKHILSTLGFSACALLGGLTATNLAPVTASTAYYQATVSLSPDPRDASNITVPTVFGDLVMGFPGLAPGIQAVPQIRADITEALAQPGVSASSLQPSSEELSNAVEKAATQLAWRFLAGAACAAAMILMAYVLVRHRRPRQWMVASTVVAVGLASVGTTGTIAATYRTDRQPTFATTGVLTAVQSNLDILDDVEARSAQVAPYLRNLIVLSGLL